MTLTLPNAGELSWNVKLNAALASLAANASTDEATIASLQASVVSIQAALTALQAAVGNGIVWQA